jgi:hypothetical protein
MTASEGPVVDNCPNCGAPLKLDTAGNCVWCQAHVRVTAPPAPQPETFDAGRAIRVLFGNPLEGEADDIMLLQPVSNLLIFLESTGQEAAVQDFLSHWEHKDAVTPLLHAVRASGERVTLSAKSAPGFNEFTDHSALYTPGEWWLIALATDLLALLAGVPGVDPMQAVEAADQARGTHDHYGEHFARSRPPDGDGSGPLSALRHAVPSCAPEPAAAGSAAGSAATIEGAGPPDGPPERHHLWRRHRDD